MTAHRSKANEIALLEGNPGLGESDEATGVWTGAAPDTELGQLLLAARREYYAAV
jgi:hypothetical protein